VDAVLVCATLIACTALLLQIAVASEYQVSSMGQTASGALRHIHLINTEHARHVVGNATMEEVLWALATAATVQHLGPVSTVFE
jgi:hypothetical protein